MIPSFRISRHPLAAVALSLLAACSTPSPEPREIAADLPESEPLPASIREQLDRDVGAALQALEDEDAESARRQAAAVLLTDPAEPRARAVLGAALALQARRDASPPALVDWRRAEGELLRATALAADDPVVTRLHAGFLEQDGHLSAAVERVEQTLTANSEQGREPVPELLDLAGRLRFDLGDESLAIAWAERQLAVEPDAADAVWRLAWARSRLALMAEDQPPTSIAPDPAAELAAAATAFARYRTLRPRDADGWLGEARIRLAQLERTAGDDPQRQVRARMLLDLYTTADGLRPGLPAASFGQGCVHELLGDPIAAEAAWQEAVERDAGYLPAWLNLGALQAADPARQAEAAESLRRALELDPSPAERDALEAWLAEHGG